MARSGRGKFSQQVAQFVDRTEQRIDIAIRSIVVGVLSDLVYLSPVGDPGRWKSGSAPAGYTGGHFRGNWQVGLNTAPSGEVSGTDASGSKTISAGIGVLAGARIGDKIVITNNVPYARRLEYGWSDQAPAGIVRITVAKFQATARAAARQA